MVADRFDGHVGGIHLVALHKEVAIAHKFGTEMPHFPAATKDFPDFAENRRKPNLKL
jgi:hypothetical protein